jgi:hypothetical protein
MPLENDKKMTRALILNALVLPGSGHISIGLRLQGIIMAAATIVFLIAPIVRFLVAFSGALKGAHTPGVSGSLSFIAAMGTAWKTHWAFILISFLAVILLWMYGIADIAVKIRRGSGKSEI